MIVTVFLAACGGDGGRVSGDIRNVSGVTVTFKADPATLQEGQTVQLTLKLVNNSGTPAELKFSSGQKYDFWITTDGDDVWRWSEGKAFTQAFVEESIPGQSGVTYTESWTPDAPGTYTVHGELKAEGYAGPFEGRVRVTP